MCYAGEQAFDVKSTQHVSCTGGVTLVLVCLRGRVPFHASPYSQLNVAKSQALVKSNS